MLLFTCAVLGGSYPATDEKRRLFAYMDTTSEDGLQKRTHVFALTMAGTLSERVTSQIDAWRTPDEGEHEPHRFSKTLEFPSPKKRNERVISLYNKIIQYNQLATKYFERQGQKVPEDHLIVMREAFGPHHQERNKYFPTLHELNTLHEFFSMLRGTGTSSEEYTSAIRGNWTELLHQEMSTYLGFTEEQVCELDLHIKDVSHTHHVSSVDWQKNENSLVFRMLDTLDNINTLIHGTEAVVYSKIQSQFSFNTLRLQRRV